VEELLGQLPNSARNLDGRVKVDKYLRPPMPSDNLVGSVLVLCDAAVFPEGDERIVELAQLPQTAQVAGQQGAYAARMLDHSYDLKYTPPVLPCLDVSQEECETDMFDDPAMARWLEICGLETALNLSF
jgi:NADH dehydrogenase